MQNEKLDKTPLTFKSLSITQAIFEVRSVNDKFYYQFRPDFWEEIQSKLPGSYRFSEDQSTNSTVARYDNQFENRVNAEQFAVVEVLPSKDLERFFHVCQIYFETAVKILEIRKIERVGFRLIFHRDYESAEVVAQEMLKLPYISFPQGLSLSNEKPLIPNYALGWKDDEKGITYRLKGNSSILSVDLPLILAADKEYRGTIEKIFNQFIFDVDVYIHKSTLPGQFFAEEWLQQSYIIVKADGKRFLGD